MTFFIDENVSHRAARMLEAFDGRNEIRAFEDSFAKGTPDVDWISAVARWSPKPTLICGDGRILRNAPERSVLHARNVMFVYLAPGWTNPRWEDFGWKIVKAWPSIVENVQRTKQATVFEVRPSSLKVQRIALVAELDRG